MEECRRQRLIWMTKIRRGNIDASDSDTVRNTSPVPIVLGIVVAVIALGALIGTYVYFKKKHKADS